MGRPISGARVRFEVIVLFKPGSTLRSYEIRTQSRTSRVSSRVKNQLIRNVIVALGCNVLDDAAL